MTNSIIETNWKKFATKVKGEIFAKPATAPGTSFIFDNSVQIVTQNEKIVFIWADQPERGKGPFVTNKTIFSFPLANNYSGTLIIYKRDFLSILLTIFKSYKVKIGDSILDNKYIFISTDKAFLKKLLPSLRSYFSNSKFTNFVVDIETLDSGKFLNFQVDSLIVDENELNLFYKFGQDIRNTFNGA